MKRVWNADTCCVQKVLEEHEVNASKAFNAGADMSEKLLINALNLHKALFMLK